MITNESAAISAVTYRVKEIEDRLAMQDHKITQLAELISYNGSQAQIDKLTSIIENIRLTIPLKTITQHIQGGHSSLEIPKELLPTIGKYRARSNRTYETVKKRWALWKLQLDAGVSATELARAWGCDRSSILYARKNRFVARASNGRKLVKHPLCSHSARRSMKRSIK